MRLGIEAPRAISVQGMATRSEVDQTAEPQVDDVPIAR